MTHLTTALAAASAVALAIPAPAQTGAPICDPAPIDAAVQQMLSDFPLLLDGAAVLVGDAEGIWYEGYFGSYAPPTVVPLASASKLVSAVAVMTLVDAGRIDPHAPIVSALPEMFALQRAGPVKPFMTVDQMESMTSGFAGDATEPILNNLDITLEQAADLIATTVTPAALPGTELNYTGYGMHVVGYLCEVISGKPYDEFFAEAVSIPLRTPSIEWDGLGETLNFRPSGGGESNLRDYGRILRMLTRRGELDGVRLLSPEAVASMFVERTVGLPVGEVPPNAQGFGYAFGMWVEQRGPGGEALVLSSPGAFGFTPWIDLERGAWGIVMVRGSNGLLAPSIRVIRDAIESALDASICRPCPLDLNHDGLLDLRDIVRFSTLGAASDPRADLNADGIFDLADINRFVSDFLNGCG
jgi:CubicO group peptidase (beta-lactamase class C family)